MAAKKPTKSDEKTVVEKTTDAETPADQAVDTTETPAEEAPSEAKSGDDAPELRAPDTTPESDTAQDAVSEAEGEPDADEKAILDSEAPENEDTPDDEVLELSEPLTDTPPPTPVTETARTETVVERKGGFVPMLLGGVAAAGLGFGASHYGLITTQDSGLDALKNELNQSLSQQAEQVAGLSAAYEDLSSAADLSTIETAQDDLSTSIGALTDRIAGIEDGFAALDTRMSDVEQRPITEGASDAAVAAYERELKALQDAMAAQRAEIEAMASEAKALEANAQETSQATMRRAALTRVQTALDSGTGFAPALAELESAGVTIPAELAAVAEDGAPSLADLQASLPDAARAALAASRQAGTSEDTGGSGFAAFLKTQLGARSLEPQEGNSPDAILSRAEAATREGRLADALAEIDALPDAGKAVLEDWINLTQQRLGALDAAETLGSELN